MFLQLYTGGGVTAAHSQASSSSMLFNHHAAWFVGGLQQRSLERLGKRVREVLSNALGAAERLLTLGQAKRMNAALGRVSKPEGT